LTAETEGKASEQRRTWGNRDPRMAKETRDLAERGLLSPQMGRGRKKDRMQSNEKLGEGIIESDLKIYIITGKQGTRRKSGKA